MESPSNPRSPRVRAFLGPVLARPGGISGIPESERSVAPLLRLSGLQPNAALGILTLLDAASPPVAPAGLCFFASTASGPGSSLGGVLGARAGPPRGESRKCRQSPFGRGARPAPLVAANRYAGDRMLFRCARPPVQPAGARLCGRDRSWAGPGCRSGARPSACRRGIPAEGRSVGRSRRLRGAAATKLSIQPLFRCASPPIRTGGLELFRGTSARGSGARRFRVGIPEGGVRRRAPSGWRGCSRSTAGDQCSSAREPSGQTEGSRHFASPSPRADPPGERVDPAPAEAPPHPAVRGSARAPGPGIASRPPRPSMQSP